MIEEKTEGVKTEDKDTQVGGVPWSLTVLELLCPAASPPPARGHSWLHSGEESDHPVKIDRTGAAAVFRLKFSFHIITNSVLKQSNEALTAGINDMTLQVTLHFHTAVRGFHLKDYMFVYRLRKSLS